MAAAATSPDLQHSANGAQHNLVDAPPLVPSTALASAPQMANPAAAAAAAAAALPVPPGLPSETAAVAAASDALIATFSAAGTGTHPKAAAAAPAAAPPAAGSSIDMSATDSSEMPHMSRGGQTGAASPIAPDLSQAQEQPHKGGTTGADSAQPEAVSEKDAARRPGTSEQPGRDAAAAPGPAQSGPAPRAVGDAGPPRDIDYGSQGRAALAAMPKIGPDSDDEDVSCVNTRYRPRTALPVKTQTKEQIELQQKLSQEVRRKWLEELQDASKVQRQAVMVDALPGMVAGCNLRITSVQVAGRLVHHILHWASVTHAVSLEHA